MCRRRLHAKRATGSRLAIEWELPDVELRTAYYYRVVAKELSEAGVPLSGFVSLLDTRDDEEATKRKSVITPPLKPLTTYALQGNVNPLKDLNV